MYSDTESTTSNFLLPRNFTRALRLLHAPDPSSIDELRCILDNSIAERYGSMKSIPRFHCKNEITCNGAFTDAGGNDVGGKDEVPRISIPDEGQADGAVCKVCNVPELGPLILIQCWNCGESYHPLCHQPSVVELCAEDPDFLWRCDECEKVAKTELAKKSSIFNYSIR